jgi:capsid protein
MAGLLNRIGSMFGYDALEPAGRRKKISRTVYREDHHFQGNKHRGLQESASDLVRNLSLAGWMVRRHLDYVAQFEFHGRNDDEGINRQIEQLMLEDSRPARADVSGRFGREKLFRLAEARRVLDGDTVLVKLRDGRLQGIQADLIQDPARPPQGEQWINGVLINDFGRPLAYGVHKRSGYTRTEFARRVNATNLIHYGFFDRYASDQVRGVSPLVSALNPLRDVYENFSFALAKAKVSQLFAMAFYRDSPDSVMPVEPDPDQGNIDSDGDSIEEPRGFQAFMKSDTRYIDLNPGEKAEVIESKQPSTEFQNFTQLVMQVALKSLDIPFSFYDESHTNFFGSRAAWLHYERSCKDKRDDQIEMRRNYTQWKLQNWIASGRLVLPASMRQTDINFEWVPRGMPWWDPSKEINGHIAAIKAGLDTPQRICRATGTDYFDNVDAISKALQYASEKGVPVEFAMQQPQQSAEEASE